MSSSYLSAVNLDIFFRKQVQYSPISLFQLKSRFETATNLSVSPESVSGSRSISDNQCVGGIKSETLAFKRMLSFSSLVLRIRFCTRQQNWRSDHLHLTRSPIPKHVPDFNIHFFSPMLVHNRIRVVVKYSVTKSM